MLCRGAGQADRVGLAIPWGSDPLSIASACGRMEATNRRPPSADLELSPQVRALEGEERELRARLHEREQQRLCAQREKARLASELEYERVELHDLERRAAESEKLNLVGGGLREAIKALNAESRALMGRFREEERLVKEQNRGKLQVEVGLKKDEKALEQTQEAISKKKRELGVGW